MPAPTDEEIKKILKKYEAKLGRSFDTAFVEESPRQVFSREYNIFKKEIMERKISSYEKFCRAAEKIITIKPSEKDREKLQRSIEICHLDISPGSAVSFAALVAILIIVFGVVISLALFFLKVAGINIFLLTLAATLAAVILIKPLSNYPNHLANKWRLEAGNQMVLCILYIVMYMRHTSNLEHAIKFAGEHIGAPLALDLRKIFWDVETEKYLTIRESLEHYLELWRDYSLEFIEAFHLIESSLYEPVEKRRIELLEKALDVILEGTYEKMLHYAHELKNPMTMLYMLGIVLPILSLVMLPLLSFVAGTGIKWYYLALMYNVALPLFVIFLGSGILAKRPVTFGESEIMKTYPEFKKYQYVLVGRNQVPVSPLFFGVMIIIFICLIGFIPFIVHYIDPSFEFEFLNTKFLDYKGEQGPYGLGALLLSLFIPLGIALGISTHYKLKTRKLIKIKREVDDLEREFSGALFQLGNRIGDNIPAELAVGEVAETMKGTPTGNFLRAVNVNIRKLGMGIKEAIFNNERGAILYFPSALIETSMKILVESAKKGPQVVAKCLIAISTYVNRIRQIDERLKDLLAEIISSMKAQISFLTPMIAGIVVGISSMVVTILNKLGELSASLPAEEVEGTLGGLAGIAEIINMGDVIPPYYFQLIIGIYVVEIAIILCILANRIERGVDRLNEEYIIGKNLILSAGLYLIIALIGILVFNALASLVGQVAVG